MGRKLGHEFHRELALIAAQANRAPYVVALKNGTMSSAKLDDYLTDTYWAVLLFPSLAQTLVDRMPSGVDSAELRQSAREELDHPAMYEPILQGRGIDPKFVQASSYVPKSRIYHYFWRWVECLVGHAPWHQAVAAVMLGIEGGAPVFEAVVAQSLVQYYGLSPEQARWFSVHSGNVEAAHHAEGVRVLERLPLSSADHAAILEIAFLAARAMVIDCPNEWFAARSANP
ncbi:iron-containing redox enzyme family protein [Nonomuraea rhizosphaerae]|uniref:iron-containing redox enzyme family protein n=1 Tax=Nonomuraea rhizosphaerae TaxID=2665663 RepID=UPI001C5D7DC0|nr:iron-containing redox enzyme family protein [Nonomuraea rhizosphaerae]